jgi:chromosomal replication initiator protein
MAVAAHAAFSSRFVVSYARAPARRVRRGKARAKDAQEVTKDDMEIVSALQLVLADKVGQERFELWFGASTRLDLANDTLTVRVPSEFYQDWLRNHFRDQIEAACRETIGQTPAVRFQVDPSLAPPQSTLRGCSAGGCGKGGLPPANGSPVPLAATLKLVSADDPPRTSEGRSPSRTSRRFADFDSFIVGPNNRLAHAAAESIVRRLGSTTPLVIHGPTGVGKTHLLEAVWTASRRSDARVQAVYLSAEQFTSLFLGALHASGLPSFRRKYRGLDVLIIDDIQFLAGKRATLIELWHTVDSFLREGRQLVFAADRPPADLPELGPELTTRLQGGLVCGIQPPEYETRLDIIRGLAARMGVEMPDDVLSYVATNLHSHARELAGAVNRLDAAGRAVAEPISLDLARETLAEMVRHGARSVRLTDIEKAVCDVFGLEPRSLQSGRRGKEVSHPRMLAMWLARKHTRAALAEIGHYFGRRSHSTVISAQKKIDGWMAARAPLGVAERAWNVEEAIRRVEESLRAG